MQYEGWEGFVPGKWNNDEVDVRDFIQRNYTPYEGDASFLAPRNGGYSKALEHRSRSVPKRTRGGRGIGRGYENRFYADFARGGLSRQGS